MYQIESILPTFNELIVLHVVIQQCSLHSQRDLKKYMN